jgi:hypothetical protein
MPSSGSAHTAQLLSVILKRIEHLKGSCFRVFFALQRHEFLTEQGKKHPGAVGRSQRAYHLIPHFKYQE